MPLFKSLNEAVEHMFSVTQQMQQALSEILAEWDSVEEQPNPDTFGMMMAREALKNYDSNVLLRDRCEIREISTKSPTLKQMQKMVGGETVELITLPDGRQMFCDEEGLLKELPINGMASIMVGGAICGPVVILSGDALWTDEEEEEEEEEEENQ